MIEQVPQWAWYLVGSGGAVLMGIFFWGLVYFLNRYVKKNDDSWDEMREAMKKLIIITTQHEMRLSENEKDIIQLNADFRGLPFVDQRKKR